MVFYPAFDSSSPVPEPAAAQRSGALVTVAARGSLRERSEARDLVPDSRTRSNKRRRLGFAGVPTMAFYL
jgi:hypothetical protein